jgi:glutamine amidotransferase-like uncharacterized protein
MTSIAMRKDKRTDHDVFTGRTILIMASSVLCALIGLVLVFRIFGPASSEDARYLQLQAQVSRRSYTLRPFEERPRTIRVAVLDLEPEAIEATQDLTQLVTSLGLGKAAILNDSAVRLGELSKYDAVVVGGGRGSLKATALGSQGKRAIAEFVANGGGYVGICGGAFLATSGYDWSLHLVDVATITGQVIDSTGQTVNRAERGAGFVDVEYTLMGGSVLKVKQASATVHYAGGPIFLIRNDSTMLSYSNLAMFRSEVCLHECQNNTMVNTPAVIAAEYGSGRAILFSFHAEMSGDDTLIRNAIVAVSRAPKADE